ncbi:MAG: glycosyltransferase family 4 protein [Actinomycetes bacterium]
MKILLVSDGSFLREVIVPKARALLDRGHEVALLIRDHARDFGGDERERAKALDAVGIRVLELPDRRHDRGNPQAIASARKAIQAWDPDIASVHENTDPRLFFLLRSIPVVYTIHDPVPHSGATMPRLPFRWVPRAWVKRASRIVVHGPQLVEEVRRFRKPRCPIDVIPLGADVKDSPYPLPARRAILMFGRMEPYKGLSVLAEAMPLVWATQPETELVVAGRGPSLTDLPEHLVSDGRVTVIDRYVSDSEREELLRRATVCVLPYIDASQSGVGVLGISRGIPTVVTDTGGLPELVSDPSLVCEPSNPDALADSLTTALELDNQARVAVLRHAKKNFSWPSIAKEYEGVLQMSQTAPEAPTPPRAPS